MTGGETIVKRFCGRKQGGHLSLKISESFNINRVRYRLFSESSKYCNLSCKAGGAFGTTLTWILSYLSGNYTLPWKMNQIDNFQSLMTTFEVGGFFEAARAGVNKQTIRSS